LYRKSLELLEFLYNKQNKVRVIYLRRTSGQGMWHAWGRCLQGFGWEARREETKKKKKTSGSIKKAGCCFTS
jgi:hypothetical protein